jgi:AcrR family transcriptional regulator
MPHDAVAPSPQDKPEDDWSEFLSVITRVTPSLEDGRKQDRSRRRQQEILRAALRVFARDGISRARIADIAAEAGMPVSSIYEYFPSKEDIAFAVPRMHLLRFYEEYAGMAAAPLPARERLRRYLWLAADFARRNPDWARTLYLEIWPSVLISANPVRQSIDDYVRVILRLLQEGEAAGEWPAGQNHYETAAILNGAVNQVIITWLLYRRPRDLMKAMGSMLDRLLGALLPGPSPRAAPATRDGTKGKRSAGGGTTGRPRSRPA